MGLAANSAVFTSLMNEVFSGIIGIDVFLYLDDVISESKSVSNHFQTLREVFSRLGQAGLKVKFSKCCFLQKEIKFLGHVLNSQGIFTLDDKVKAVANFPRPQSLENVHRPWAGPGNMARK